MKKLLALILSLAIIISVVGTSGILSLMAVNSGDSDSPDSTSINFDDHMTYYKSYKPNSKTPLSKTIVTNKVIAGVTTSGYYLKFGYMNGSEKADPDAIRLCNTDGRSAFKVTKGNSYSIKFSFYNQNIVHPAKIDVIFIQSTDNVSKLGSVKTLTDNGLISKGVSIKSDQPKKWDAVSGEFTAPCDAEIAIMFSSEKDMDYGNQSIIIDNLVVERNVEVDGTTVDVKYNYNNGDDAKTITMKTGYSYGYPVYDGYLFDGWYRDKDLKIPAPNTVRSNCSEVFAKWTLDERTPHKTNNTYDEEEIELIDKNNGMVNFSGKNFKDTELTARMVPTTITEKDEVTGAETQNRVMKIDQVAGHDWPWPVNVKVYDLNDPDARFDLHSNTAYKIKVKYKVNKDCPKSVLLQAEMVAYGIGNPHNSNYSPDNILVEQIAKLNTQTDGWVEAESIFYTGNYNSGHAQQLALSCVSADGWGVEKGNLDIYIDDVEVEEFLDVKTIYYNTNGGTVMENGVCVSGLHLPKINVPTKEGYTFAGWYLDPEFIQPLNTSYMPKTPLELFAKWSNAVPTVSDYSTDFEINDPKMERYSNKKDKINDDDHDLDGNISNDVHTNTVANYNKDSLNANQGDGLIKFENPENFGQSSSTWNTIALLNDDGTNYTVVSGQKYHIVYAFKAEGALGGGQTMKILTTEQMPALGINSSNSGLIDTYQYSSISIDDVQEGEWGVHDVYVEAASSGNVYLAYYSPKPMQSMSIDTLSITPVTDKDAVTVTYYYENKKIAKRVYGAPGQRLVEANPQHKDGYKFNGWRYSDGKLFDTNVFPTENADIYATFVETEKADSNTSTDWSKEQNYSFEETENARTFYGDNNNTYSAETGVYLVTNDPDNAHSGNNYFKFYKVGHWMEIYYRRFRLFSANTPANQIWLDPDSVYKISYYIKVDDCDGAVNLFTALFDDPYNMEKYTVAAENYMTLDSELQTTGQWKKVESLVTTGEKTQTLGFAMYGGYLTASIDDISVKKLKSVKISFETNGGNVVSDIEQLSDDIAIAPAPPEREGYEFDGWYTDPGLTNPFDFSETIINSDMVLYAKWKEVVVPEPQYKTVTNKEYTEETTTVKVKDDEADTKISVSDGDEIKKVNKTTKTKNTKNNDDKSGFPVLPFVIGGAVIVLAGVTVAIVLISKKKTVRRKTNEK